MPHSATVTHLPTHSLAHSLAHSPTHSHNLKPFPRRMPCSGVRCGLRSLRPASFQTNLQTSLQNDPKLTPTLRFRSPEKSTLSTLMSGSPGDRFPNWPRSHTPGDPGEKNRAQDFQKRQFELKRTEQRLRRAESSPGGPRRG